MRAKGPSTFNPRLLGTSVLQCKGVPNCRELQGFIFLLIFGGIMEYFGLACKDSCGLFALRRILMAERGWQWQLVSWWRCWSRPWWQCEEVRIVSDLVLLEAIQIGGGHNFFIGLFVGTKVQWRTDVYIIWFDNLDCNIITYKKLRKPIVYWMKETVIA